MSRKLKAISVWVLVVLVLCLFSGCGQTSKQEEPEDGTSSEAEEPFKVALLTPGPVSDEGWNAMAYTGLQRIEKEVGAEIAHMETASPGDMKEGFRDFATRGFQLVIGHGYEYQDAAAEVSDEFPDTIFITTGGTTVKENVAPIVIKAEENTYLMGIITAMMSETGKAGLIGGMEIPSITRTFVGFEAGVKSVNPDFEIMTTYVGSWSDVAAGYEAAMAQIEAGADFIFANGDAIGLGVIQACQEKGVYCFGVITDQASLAPEIILVSGIQDMTGAFVEVARRVKEKTYESGPQELGLKEGVVPLVWNPQLEAKVPENVRKAVDEAEQAIIDGNIVVPTGTY
jgi:basic membrane protein A